MKKKIHLPKLSLNKKVVAPLMAPQTAMMAGTRISDPLTENPCDPLPSMVICTRRAC
ncbi:class I lanthipeptide [Chitinophaga sp. HK235]|uniref:class I lanthipeptide n=1 Tax=Chitinophaga sp. HK235 TaxID=2952571 RepID=UPI001BAD5C76|nr:class I lanthipeptide [Chitinophaga sp. HK235]